MADPLDALRLPIVPIDPRPEFAAAVRRRIEGTQSAGARETPTVRYFVGDLDTAVGFYRDQLAFEVELRPSPDFAMLYRGDLRLVLSVPGRGHVLADGTLPGPGGWNRISLQVTDLASTVEALRSAGTRFRTGIVTGGAIRHAVVEDPSGNFVELFEPLAGYHERPRDDARNSERNSAS
jgi:catechol 2,3-dioxygenase-like lactoylglutathione lyase family enzyme